MRCCVLVWFVCLAAYSVQAKLHWWQRAIFYQVYPRSFQDSNGDGVGDIGGIAQKAHYFKDIGVDAIWISPFYTSPMKDFGYDVANFTEIDPIFGNINDFKLLSKKLSDLGIRLVVDFVPNHSSDQHPWFQMSCKRIAPYTDYYVWNNGTRDPNAPPNSRPVPPNNWMSVFEGSAWEWNEDRQQYYYHAFLKEQPDLNYNNPAVVEAMEDVMRFWLQMGVDGFRLDSANYMFESDDVHANEVAKPGTDGTHWADYYHNLTQNQDKTFLLFDQWAQLLYNYTIGPNGKPLALFMETYTDLWNTMRYYGKGNTSLMQPFNFELLVHANQSSRAPWVKELIDTWLNNMPDGDVPNWVVGNHDNGRVADRYGFEMVDAINLLTGVLPGIKVTYNGAELGMRDTFVRWDETVDPYGKSLGPFHYQEVSRDPERTPMQWDSSISAGFSTNKTTWLPVNPNYWWLNVDEEMKAPRSHLKVFQALAKARKDPILLLGDVSVQAPDDDTLVVLRSLNESHFLLLINMGSELRYYTSQNFFAPMSLDIDMVVNITSINVAAHNVGDLLKSKSLNVTLRPKSAIVLRTPLPSGAARLLGPLPLLLGVALRVLWR